MITAHLPAGYILARTQRWDGTILAAALVGSVFPDFDLLAFYLVDDRAFHHHHYWVHAPAFALICGAVALLVSTLFAKRLSRHIMAFCAAWLLHIVLDSLAGGIMWLWPASGELFRIIEVPPRDGIHWLVAFLTHWTILLELVIWGVALALFWRQRRMA
ncbi:metal-dependent hydrolase [Rhodobacterales bacterium HKCCE4037]|nr:metal-dependent hydrolase [Rhodobacterales bacterium HKCCE4037]